MQNSLFSVAKSSISPQSSSIFLTKVDSKKDLELKGEEGKVSHKTLDSARSKNKSAITSSYRQGAMPTANSKFEAFVRVVLQSNLKQEDVQADIVKYHRKIETAYADRIAHLAKRLEKAQSLLV